MKTKKCTKCGVEKPRTKEYFASDRRHKDGLQSQCRKCDCDVTKNWNRNNKKKIKKYHREYDQQNREELNKYSRERNKTLKEHVGKVVADIKVRCTNPNCKSYKYYGGRGIKCLFTVSGLCSWIIINDIDPRGLCIHRIDNDGNYALDNITFLTKSKHSKLHNKMRLNNVHN